MEENKVEQIEYNGYFINIYPESCPLNPRKDFDQMGVMVCFHSHYDLGDRTEKNPNEVLYELAKEVGISIADTVEYWGNGKGYESIVNRLRKSEPNGVDYVQLAEERVQFAIQKIIDKHYFMLPLYLYDHSGITMNTTGFACGWDSGQVGFIYVSKEDVRKEYGVTRISPQVQDRVYKRLRAEVEEYDQYIRGDVYGFRISDDSKEDNELDSCWGFFGDYETSGLLEQARGFIDWKVQEDAKEQQRKQTLEGLTHA